MRNFICRHAPGDHFTHCGVVAAASCGLVIRSKGISFMTIAAIFVADVARVLATSLFYS